MVRKLRNKNILFCKEPKKLYYLVAQTNEKGYNAKTSTYKVKIHVDSGVHAKNSKPNY